jgi:rhodanese-related sulfurtransferase
MDPLSTNGDGRHSASGGPEPTPPVSAIERHLVDVRAGYERVGPAAAADLYRRGALLVDIRPAAQRERFGGIPAAVVIERNVLEWRLDPTSPDRHPSVDDDPDRVVVVICQEGYASSLAAASLRGLGLGRATDLEGGFVAWKAAGLPVSGGPPAR